jgi:hypothetical protein
MIDKHQSLTNLAQALRNLAAIRKQEEERPQMNSRDFMYWLRGYLESNGTTGITSAQVKVIDNHLGLALQTEANAKRLTEDYDRARITKMLHEADAADIGHRMSQRGMPAAC